MKGLANAVCLMPMRATTTSTAAILIACGLSSCGIWQVGKPMREVNVPHPQSWAASGKGDQGRIATGWIKEFKSAPLEQAVATAMKQNHDLQVTAARLREAQQQSRIGRAGLLPSADLGTAAIVTDSMNAPTRDTRTLGLSAAWEIDLWGRLRNLKNATYANEAAALADYRAARLSLAANTAKAWSELISSEQQLTLAKATLESFERNLRIIERNYKGTGEGALDIQFGRNNVFSAKRSVESRQLERDEAARSLELLLGQYPEGKTRHGQVLPEISRSIPAGLPAELLERRPDLVAARARLFASAEAADAARKSLLPSLSLTGSSGNTASQFSQLLDLDQLINVLSARLTQTLTEGGALTAAARAVVERNQAQVHRYAQTVLGAFREVESAIAADHSLAVQEQHLDSELEQAILAEKQAERNYTEGINPNILSVLEAQRRANNARSSMIRLKNQRIQNRIDLHLALGGDFETQAP